MLDPRPSEDRVNNRARTPFPSYRGSQGYRLPSKLRPHSPSSPSSRVWEQGWGERAKVRDEVRVPEAPRAGLCPTPALGMSLSGRLGRPWAGSTAHLAGVRGMLRAQPAQLARPAWKHRPGASQGAGKTHWKGKIWTVSEESSEKNVLSVKPDIPQRWVAAQNSRCQGPFRGTVITGCFTTGEIRSGDILTSDWKETRLPHFRRWVFFFCFVLFCLAKILTRHQSLWEKAHA